MFVGAYRNRLKKTTIFQTSLSIEFRNINTYGCCRINDMKSAGDEGLLTADGNINKTWLW